MGCMYCLRSEPMPVDRNRIYNLGPDQGGLPLIHSRAYLRTLSPPWPAPEGGCTWKSRTAIMFSRYLVEH